MKKDNFFPLVASGLIALLLQFSSAPACAKADGPSALTGRITSRAEGRMEGVVVSAKRDGSIVTVSVSSDEKGVYRFPADRLEAGHYYLKIRAVGYDLDGPKTATVVANKTTTANLKLKETDDLAAQLTSAEWLASIPGTQDQKEFARLCIECHTFGRIPMSRHNADEWTHVLRRMFQYAYVSFTRKPQIHMDPNRGGKPEQYRTQAEYLSSINMSSVSKWSYSLKTWPRPTGRATRAIVTEYDLPRQEVQPHDVIVDKDGIVWYLDFGGLLLGKFDPKTLKFKEYAIKENKPGYPTGGLDLEMDPTNGTLWFDMMHQAAIGNFDPKTEKFTYYRLPKKFDSPSAQIAMLGLHHEVDNKVWTKEEGKRKVVYRIDLATGEWETFDPLKDLPGGKLQTYQVMADSKNNLWMAEIYSGYLGKIDAKTRRITWYMPPTPRSGVRRMNIDDEGRIVFAEYFANQIGRFDPSTLTFTEWPLPQGTGPYRPALDKNGEIWTGGMATDRVVRLDPKTGESIEYLMPSSMNMRSAFVDKATTSPTFWVGSNHGAALVKVEPLD